MHLSPGYFRGVLYQKYNLPIAFNVQIAYRFTNRYCAV